MEKLEMVVRTSLLDEKEWLSRHMELFWVSINRNKKRENLPQLEIEEDQAALLMMYEELQHHTETHKIKYQVSDELCEFVFTQESYITVVDVYKLLLRCTWKNRSQFRPDSYRVISRINLVKDETSYNYKKFHIIWLSHVQKQLKRQQNLPSSIQEEHRSRLIELYPR